MFTSNQSKTALNNAWWILMREDNRGWTFSLDEALLWTIDCILYFGQKQLIKVKKALCIGLLQKCSFHNTLIDGLEWCGLLVDYCGVFISCLDSHSDGTHSLQRIHWWTSDVMLHFSTSVPKKKQTHQHLGWPGWGWVNCQQISIVTWTITLMERCASQSFVKRYSFIY